MRRLNGLIGTLVALASLVVVPMGQAADVSVVRGPAVDVRPGPDALYDKGASPQLENAGIWRAEPILVSGASAYRQGEFLYQDYLFDESGTYPEDPAYAFKNNADLVELRLKPTESGTAVRLTLNSMQDFADIGLTIALGGQATQPRMVPHGAGARMPADVFVTVHGSSGDIVEAASGQALPQKPEVSVDVRRRQVDVLVPYAAFDPRNETARVGGAIGLWDKEADAYRAKESGAAFFNVAFRYTESGTWASDVQTAALSSGDLSTFFADVDFSKLASNATDDMAGEAGGVPQTGQIARISASSFERQQGRGPSSAIGGTEQSVVCKEPCDDRLVDFPGRLQPYSLYVPAGRPPDSGYPIVYWPHACGLNYRPLPAGSQPSAMGDALNALVVLPNGRAGCQWYWSLSGTDVFEAVGDVMRRYPVDDDLVYITGGSMGGYGTYRMSGHWPDLFARTAPIIGCTAAETGWTGPGAPPRSGEAATIHRLAPSWRNVPMWSTIGALDDTCQTSSNRVLLAAIDKLGYRYEWREYPGEHVTGALEPAAFEPSQYAAWFKGSRVVRNPSHVTYVYNVRADERRWKLDADHAYWLSGLAARDLTGEAPMATIDVVSHGFGEGDPPASATEMTAGPGYTGQRKGWGETPKIPVEDRLDITATNLATVTIDVARARVSCDPKLNVKSDGPVTITLAGCSKATLAPSKGGPHRHEIKLTVRRSAKRLNVSGVVTPRHPGHVIRIQRLRGTKAKSVGTFRLNSQSGFRRTLRASTRRSDRFRAVLLNDAGGRIAASRSIKPGQPRASSRR